MTASRVSRVAPDRASLYVIVEGTAETAPDAVTRVETKLKTVGAVIGGLLNAGAANTSTLTFESSAIDSVRRARIGDALGVAHSDAEAIATSLGGHVGPLVDVSTTTQPSFQPPQTLMFDNRFGGQTIAPEITVTTSVTVRYRLVH